MIEFRHIRGHIEVFENGIFLFSADTMAEAHKMLLEEENG